MSGKADWHLDQKVTLGLILALFLNAASSIWWASRLDTTVTNHEVRIVTNSNAIASNTAANASLKEGVARLQEGQKYQTEMLKEIKDRLNVDR